MPAAAEAQSASTTASHPANRVIIVTPTTEVPGTEKPCDRMVTPAHRNPIGSIQSFYYSTAKRTEGDICCFETLSSTFTVNLYVPG